MPLTKKAYFTLEELEERWSLPRRDIAYLAENGHLRLTIRSPGLMIERIYTEESPENGWIEVPYEQTWHDGMLDLLARDVGTLFQEGRVEVRAFQCGGEFVRLADPSRVYTVKLPAVVVLREERDRVEVAEGLSAREPVVLPCPTCTKPPKGQPLVAADFPRAHVLIVGDGRYVQIGDRCFRLGRVQAGVISRLHSAAVAGTPWVDGKRVLRESGAQSERMSDVFKSQPHWRELIAMDGRGNYRIAVEPCTIGVIGGVTVGSGSDGDPTLAQKPKRSA